MATSQSWNDPHRCPFCGGRIPSPGKGFILHVNDHPECEADFETWRDRVSEDVTGGWTG